MRSRMIRTHTKSIDHDSAVLMNKITGSKLEIKEEVKVDMCKAIDDMRMECKEEGKDEEKRTCIQNLMDTMNWSESQAMDALKIPLSERSKYSISVI